MQLHSLAMKRLGEKRTTPQTNAVNVCTTDSISVRTLIRVLRNVAAVDVSKIALTDACVFCPKRNEEAGK